MSTRGEKLRNIIISLLPNSCYNATILGGGEENEVVEGGIGSLSGPVLGSNSGWLPER